MELKEKLFKLGGEMKDSAEKLAKSAVGTSKKVAEKTKIKTTISREESKLSALYIEIGKKYEELFGGNAAQELATLLEEVADQKRKIADAKDELAAVDSSIVCPGCGAFVSEEHTFCPKCGAKQEKQEKVEIVETTTEATASDTSETVVETTVDTL